LVIKIGLDIDGVVADSFPVFRRELNRHYGKDIARIDSHDMARVYDVEWEEINAFFDENVEYLFSEPKPMEGALETIKSWLTAKHEIVYITARRKGFEEKVTLEWLDRNNIPYNKEKTFFSGGASKASAVREFKLDIFIDDFMFNALEVAELNVPVLLLDAPYNQGKLPQGVTRCYNWEEIRCHVDKL